MVPEEGEQKWSTHSQVHPRVSTRHTHCHDTALRSSQEPAVSESGSDVQIWRSGIFPMDSGESLLLQLCVCLNIKIIGLS